MSGLCRSDEEARLIWRLFLRLAGAARQMLSARKSSLFCTDREWAAASEIALTELNVVLCAGQFKRLCDANATCECNDVKCISALCGPKTV
ncbi:hypothetical protein BaRGS_00000441 [Batillaria attramentaria]|uniref:Uncharacterized protein n=1 Tax=Batillaria attramentaria TaxID=370345 RepID=A0ABD0M8Y9_9CAEN